MSDKVGKESQYMFSQPELGLDPPIGSDRESGCDKYNICTKWHFHALSKSFTKYFSEFTSYL